MDKTSVAEDFSASLSSKADKIPCLAYLVRSLMQHLISIEHAQRPGTIKVLDMWMAELLSIDELIYLKDLCWRWCIQVQLHYCLLSVYKYLDVEYLRWRFDPVFSSVNWYVIHRFFCIRRHYRLLLRKILLEGVKQAAM